VIFAVNALGIVAGSQLGLAAPLVGVEGSGTAVPMALLIALFGTAALVAVAVATQVRRPRLLPRPAER
jgi:hypothetical protein